MYAIPRTVTAIALLAVALAPAAGAPAGGSRDGFAPDPPPRDGLPARSGPATARSAIRDALPGTWIGEGSLFGRPAAFRMAWSNTLEDRFLELSYRIDGEVGMEARGFYRFAQDGTVDGTWVDSRGEILTLRGMARDSALEIEWSSPSESGRTTYRLLADGGIAVADAVRAGDDWRPFGEAVYARDGAP